MKPTRKQPGSNRSGKKIPRGRARRKTPDAAPLVPANGKHPAPDGLDKMIQAHLAKNPRNRAQKSPRYQDLFESAPDGYLVTNRSGQISQVNKAAAEMLNSPRNYLTLKPLTVYIAASDRDRFWAAIHSMRHLPRGEWMFRLMPRDRAPITVQATANAILSPGGEVVGLRWILRDITLQQHAVEYAAAAREKLQSLAANIAAAEERERRRIAVDVHDRLSQPLAMARMNIGRLRKNASPEQLHAIEEVAKLLDTMIQESRTLTFELSPPMLYEIGFAAAIASLGDHLHRDHKLRVTVREDAPIEPTELRVLLFQFARELLTNVVKHASATAVVVTVRHEGEHSIIVTVADDGDGFNSANITKSRSSFGLFSIRTRLEQLGGFLRVESGPDSGTCITMTIPSQAKLSSRIGP